MIQRSLFASSVSGIRDNYKYGSAGDFLSKAIQPGDKLSVVSAYFTIYAFQNLYDQLISIESLDFLFGEPSFLAALDPSRTEKKYFSLTEEGLSLQNQLQQKRLARLCAAWIKEKVRVKSVREANLLHGKLYHIAGNGQETAMLGSSNFTTSGLGLGNRNRNNIELNLVVDNEHDRTVLKEWFDSIWNDEKLVKDVKDEVLAYLARLYTNYSPDFIYYKTLFHIFEQFLLQQDADGDKFNEQTRITDTAIWQTLFEFQKDGVRAAINKIQRHNGCIIADSVGLGKTFEALAVIKYFELLNARVLVLCPKKLRENWTIYQAQNNSELNPFGKDRFSYTVLTHTDLSRESGKSGDIDLGNINWGNYDLVVIDESHNFRNNTKGKREDGQIVRKSRYERLMEDVLKSGVRTKVLLLSATPVNNTLQDLRNQLYFITEGSDTAFSGSMGVPSLNATLVAAQRTFADWSKRNDRQVGSLLESLNSAFFKLLDELTIARSRRHIQQYYAATLEKLGGFPQRKPPLALYADIDRENLFPSYDTLNNEISEYRLALFNPSRYVLPEHKALYERDVVQNFSQGLRERYLVGMMKVNFLKRLESSIYSFAITMQRTEEKIKELENRILRFRQLQNQKAETNFEVSDAAPADSLDDEELEALSQIGRGVSYRLEHLNLDAWLKDLGEDKRQIHRLHITAKDVSAERDAKLAELKKHIAAKVRQPALNKNGESNRKVLIFTAFADTARYLYEQLQPWATTELDLHSALVTGSGENRTTFGDREFNRILTNFAPRSKNRAKMRGMPQQGEIDLLIATDCISEGQNLQDCDCVINYDIHWNPVRLIQRFGRIDRINSPNQTVQLINFWPTPDLNNYINLKNRVEARMALVDLTATGADNLLANPTDAENLVQNELSYRDKQLLRLKDEVLDLEDFSESVALNEFTLDDFRMDLIRYIENNRRQLETAPLGLYAVVPPNAAQPLFTPGVIFCLRQRGESGGNEKINPLQPYFLFYVRDDGEVRYGFAHPKQILEAFRGLCQGVTKAYDDLCQIFDRSINDGADMQLYDKLVEAAVNHAGTTFKKRAFAGLLGGRGAVIPEQSRQVNTATEFELISWLAIIAEP